MEKGFWEKLKKPFFILAPMHEVTDIVFRQMFVKYGKPDVFFTEFVSVDGLCSQAKEKLLPYFAFEKNEKPIVAQIFGAKPDNFFKVAKLIKTLGFDGIDINMGCPDKKIEKQGAGASLIKNPKLAREIIQATKKGAGKLPVSIKTRIGYDKNILTSWLPELLAEAPVAITIHARTRKEMFSFPSHWEMIKEAVKIAKKSETLIIGNGDIKNLKEAKIKAKETGADGIMIGRAAIGNPWIFNSKKDKQLISPLEKIIITQEHAFLFYKNYQESKNFAVLKKHFNTYITGFPLAKKIRIQLMETKNLKEAQKILAQYKKEF
ncbi:tRNA-dihydrouridine synthase [Candidatus Kuenenbacteria bacterium HGW-Kuenenbacteria-1]|uniref:tRNA-dihydrouridine synthase n=1 Tax=Candidatus Kuenenbacteria bacterium HGW-Kuenenbacteria-1 TaxID=2013812 RepID=A0A2N1UPB3_9BACT|nr:MAG: tRNA-dihydrouridine synthase [Candidatus Kuenenbacteria bacterium HGW-Kuenenbacteria-1]